METETWPHVSVSPA